MNTATANPIMKAQRQPQRGETEDMSPQNSEQEAPDPQAMMDKQRESLERLMAARIADAVDARTQSGIEDLWLEAEDQYNGIDDLTPAQNMPPSGYRPPRDTSDGTDQKSGVRSRVFLPITKAKTDSVVAHVCEKVLPHDDKPWAMEPTPIPEFAEAADGNDQRMLTLADGSEVPAEQVAAAMMMRAEKAAEAQERQVEDWFVEGRVYPQLRRVIRDSGRIGTGAIKGPFPVTRKDKKWSVSGNNVTLNTVSRIAPTSIAISVWDVFPDPACGDDIHDGAFLCERDYWTGRRLRDFAQLPDVDTKAVAEILREGPQKRTRFDDRDMRENEGQVPTHQTDTFEVWFYYGDIPPEDLLAGGWVIAGFNDAPDAAKLSEQIDLAMQLTSVPVVATMVNERVVRITLNPIETGSFPIDLMVWEPVDGQPWGRGVPHKMSVAQKITNSAARAMLENAGMSAGPQVVVDKDRIEPANGRWEITGRKLWYWTPGEEVKDVRFAFQSVMIESAQAQLQAIVDFGLKMADESTNLPMLMQGAVGTAAPETLGGQAMAVANASAPLRMIAKQFDDGVITRHLTRYQDWLMQDPNVSKDAKDGDIRCRARGSSTLIYRDMAAQFLPQLAGLLDDPGFDMNKKRWMEEVLRGNRVNPIAVQNTPEESKALQEKLAKSEGQQQDPRIVAAQATLKGKELESQARLQNAEADRKFKAQEAALDRQWEELIKRMDVEIQAMQFSNNRNVTMEQIRAMLAKTGMEIRNKRDLFSAERQFAVTDGQGRGL